MSATNGPPDLEITGATAVLPSRYDVTGLATDAVARATMAAAELLAARTGEPIRRVLVDRIAACAAFAGERLFRPDGWELPPIWDPIAGDYRCRDGWIRLHTNYANHRAAALRALRLPPDCASRDEVHDRHPGVDRRRPGISGGRRGRRGRPAAQQR
jgi:hypothetical protein